MPTSGLKMSHRETYRILPVADVPESLAAPPRPELGGRSYRSAADCAVVKNDTLGLAGPWDLKMIHFSSYPAKNDRVRKESESSRYC